MGLSFNTTNSPTNTIPLPAITVASLIKKSPPWNKSLHFHLSQPKTAAQKVQLAEDAWNTRNPEKVAQWYRAYGNENWEFDDNGLMKKRYASINDVPIREEDRCLR